MSDKRRRKSLSIFRPTLSTLATVPASDVSRAQPIALKKKKSIANSIIHSLSTPASPASPSSPRPESVISEKTGHVESPKIRARNLQRTSRTSMFGSLRSLRSFEDEEKLEKMDSRESSDKEDEETPKNVRGLLGSHVLHHGEVQTTGGMFRKRSQYLVLTETHLIRFKSQGRAAEMFSVIPATLGRSNTNRQSSVSSIGSCYDMQLVSYADITSGIALNEIIAVYKLDDGRPYFSIEVSHMDDRGRRAACMHMQLNEPREAESWLFAIRTAAASARMQHGSMFLPDTISYIARVLDRERDYDPEHFHIFRVVQRASNKAIGRSSSDDLAKLNSTICYLGIGINKIHLIPLQKTSTRSSTSSLNDFDVPVSFGIMTLTSLSLHAGEDPFQLSFRAPLRNAFAVHLASSSASEIALWIRHASEYLRPEWLHQPFIFIVPRGLEDQLTPPEFAEEDHKYFDRTLIAYCAAYEINASKICYTIDYACEDAPCFRLLAAQQKRYTALELLAVMRSLRYNESFASISFAGISLDALRSVYDPYGIDLDCLYTRSGTATQLQGHNDLCVLAQEIRALALKSKRLRRLDFSRCLSTKTLQKTVEDPDRMPCGIPEALVPLCKRSLTNVDWIILNGISLSESDVEHLVDAASERACHLRALEIGDCGLSVHDVDVLLSTMAVHESTMEVIDISCCQGRFSPELFQRQIGYFVHIRKLDLTRVQKTAGPEPLIAPETLLNWRLQALYLSQTTMNEQTVDSISAYLSSPKSDTLRELHLNQCGLTGKDLAIFFRAMSREDGKAREMHVSASENRLRIGYTLLFDQIANNRGPTHLTTRMIEFEKEQHFRHLIKALTNNTTLKALDISRASLPYDAGKETCLALQQMLAENECLEVLDISGEHALLESTRFGIGLNLALTGLKKNKSLKVLKIEHQNLGLEGANTLAEVLEENGGLVEIHCENNEISLQSFTILVNALQKNTTILHVPALHPDRELQFERLKREIEAANKTTDADVSTMGIKRRLTAGLGSKGDKASVAPHSSPAHPPTYSDQDVRAALDALSEKWDAEVARMQRYLSRNERLAQGLPWEEQHVDADGPGNSERPKTSESLSHVLRNVQLESTPTLEKKVRLEYMEVKEKVGGQRQPVSFSLMEE